MSQARALPQDYPPREHVLRDLGLWSEAGGERARAGLRVERALLGPAGACRAGVLAVLVDVVAGGAALRSVAESSNSWIATSDLSVHWHRPVAAGELVASATPLRSGRTSVVVEVTVESDGAIVAHGTVGFARLEAQGAYQRTARASAAQGPRVDWGEGRAPLAVPFAGRLGVAVRDAREGVLELPVGPYVGNSLGGLQGGVAVALLDLAAEAAGGAGVGGPVASRDRLEGPVATRDLSVHFLAIARVGPVRTRARVLRSAGDALLLRVEARDAGAEDRLTTLATAWVARC